MLPLHLELETREFNQKYSKQSCHPLSIKVITIYAVMDIERDLENASFEPGLQDPSYIFN